MKANNKTALETSYHLFFELLQVSLGLRTSLSVSPSVRSWSKIFKIAEEQAITGVLISGLDKLPTNQRPPQLLLLEWIGQGEAIRQRNKVMDDAVIRLFKKISDKGVEMFVFKGQTIAALYTDVGLRQSGDIDFFVFPNHWDKAISIIGQIEDGHSPNHVEYVENHVQYEMHRRMLTFSYWKHNSYWKKMVMPEITKNPCYVTISGYEVPTLAPTYNILYVFCHLFHHFITDGVGLRQFIDWKMLLRNGGYDVETLDKHLKGVGLKNAFVGMGAILIDYLGLPESEFPYAISNKDHERAASIMGNIMRYGNLGHNKAYKNASGVWHGVERLGRIIKQSMKFGYLAPVESWGRIGFFFSWWSEKLSRRIKN